MKRQIIRTDDGSVTIHLPEWGESYHSKYGAMQEAYHVFIRAGLDQLESDQASILEIGFGTGLNGFITYLESKRKGLHIDYTGVEAFPISNAEVAALNYPEALNAINSEEAFKKMHASAWEERIEISHGFTLIKRLQTFDAITDIGKFDLIYFDAFGYAVQPELWSEAIFRKMFAAMKPGGILVTYAARSVIRRNMIAAGLTVEKLPGPIGKREMLRARKY